MRVLFASQCCPWPLDNGTHQRIYHLIQALAEQHEITLISPATNIRGEPQDQRPLAHPRIRPVTIPPHAWALPDGARFQRWAPLSQRIQNLLASAEPSIIQRWRSAPLVKWLADFGRQERFDAVWVERSYLAESVRRAGFRNITVDVDEIETIALMRVLDTNGRYLSKPLHYAEAAKLYAYERRLPRRYDKLIVCKEEDHSFFGQHLDNVFVVPNGTEAHHVGNPEHVSDSTLLFVGGLNYEPNGDAIRYFHDSIFSQVVGRCPKSRFVIVGRNAPPDIQALHDGIGCIVASSVPDVGPYYEGAAVVVVPMRQGVGTKLKLLEALGRGKAVVATSIGAQGIDVRPGIDLEIADTPSAFADACVRLLENPDQRLRLGANGRRRVLDRYSWNAVGQLANAVLAHKTKARESWAGAAGAPHLS